MKNTLRPIPAILALILFLLMGHSIQAQQVSPRTGNLPEKQVLTEVQFNQLPAEIQSIVKNNPALYTIQNPKHIVSAEEFEALPADKKKYMKDQADQYLIREKSASPSGLPPTDPSRHRE